MLMEIMGLYLFGSFFINLYIELCDGLIGYVVEIMLK